MLSLELKDKLINPKYNGIWTSISESVSCVENPENQEDYFPEEPEYYLDQVVLELKIILPDNVEYSCYVYISFPKTDEAFIKSLTEYKENKFLKSYETFLKERTNNKYSDEIYQYLIDKIYTALEKTIQVLKPNNN